MNTFVRRLNSLLSLAQESWNRNRKGAVRRHRPAAASRPRLTLEVLEDRKFLSSNLPTAAPAAQLAVIATTDHTAGQKTSVMVEAQSVRLEELEGQSMPALAMPSRIQLTSVIAHFLWRTSAATALAAITLFALP